MSELLQIGLVAEGHTDFVIIEAALSAILDCSFVLTLLQPEPTQPTLGGGWSGVSGKNHESPCYSWSAAPFIALSSKTIK